MFRLIYSDLLVKEASGNSYVNVDAVEESESRSIDSRLRSASDFSFFIKFNKIII
jgi:hypothetical protein